MSKSIMDVAGTNHLETGGRKMTMTERKSGLAHCCHHDTHWEFCYEFNERVAYIRANKPEHEQALRLRLFQLVPDEILPGRDSPEWAAIGTARAAYVTTRAAYDKAGAAYDKAWAALDKARVAYDTAGAAYLSKYQTELDAMHDKLFPDCPWDGRTIFGKEVLK